MKKLFLITILASLIFQDTLHAQVSLKDSAIFTTLIYATYAYQFPGGDLAERFGSNSSIGGGLKFKTAGNWIFGFEGNYMFGQSVKNGPDLLKGISTTEGYIIDANGFIGDVVYYERGYTLFGMFGKLLPVLGPNPNSGITLTGGGGYIQNKIRLHNPGNTAPQIYGDYKRGYDRLNGGIALNGNVGYHYMSNSRLLNFSVALEFTQAWTKPYRERDFDTGLKDTRKYSSQFYGIRVAWFVPLYKRAPKEFYLY